MVRALEAMNHEKMIVLYISRVIWIELIVKRQSSIESDTNLKNSKKARRLKILGQFPFLV